MKLPLLMLIAATTLAAIKPANGANITAVSDGNWTTNSVWSCNCQPTNSDNITIPAGRTVTANASPILILGPVITITVGGVLILQNSSLAVDGNDIVTVLSGGRITGAGFFGGTVSSGLVPIPVANGSSINGPSSITGGTLPIKLISFHGESVGSKIKLIWASATEENFSHYNVTRSNNGKYFETVGTVQGASNSVTRRDYEFEDVNPTVGRSYYRLEAVDIDGSKESFSMVTIIHQPDERNITIYPNPIREGKINIQFSFNSESNPEVMMYDNHGALVMKRSLQKEELLAKVDLPSNLEKGVYIVIIKSAGLDYQSTVTVD